MRSTARFCLVIVNRSYLAAQPTHMGVVAFDERMWELPLLRRLCREHQIPADFIAAFQRRVANNGFFMVQGELEVDEHLVKGLKGGNYKQERWNAE